MVHIVELVGRILSVREGTTRPGSRSPERVPMTSPEVGVNPMVVSTWPSLHRREARAGAEVGQDDPAAASSAPGDPRQLFHQVA